MWECLYILWQRREFSHFLGFFAASCGGDSVGAAEHWVCTTAREAQLPPERLRSCLQLLEK